MSSRGEQLLSKFLDFEDLSVSLQRDVECAVPSESAIVGTLHENDSNPSRIRSRGGGAQHEEGVVGRVCADSSRKEAATKECELTAKVMLSAVNIEMDEPYYSSFVEALASLLEHYSSTFRSHFLLQQNESAALQLPTVDAQMSSSEQD
jgi:hypothetical protein